MKAFKTSLLGSCHLAPRRAKKSENCWFCLWFCRVASFFQTNLSLRLHNIRIICAWNESFCLVCESGWCELMHHCPRQKTLLFKRSSKQFHSSRKIEWFYCVQREPSQRLHLFFGTANELSGHLNLSSKQIRHHNSSLPVWARIFALKNTLALKILAQERRTHAEMNEWTERSRQQERQRAPITTRKWLSLVLLQQTNMKIRLNFAYYVNKQ